MGKKAVEAGDLDEILAALAVLGQADWPALAALRQDPESAPPSSPPDDLAQALRAQPSVRQQGDQWIIDPAVASELLAWLEHEDLATYRRLHERAVAHLAGRLQAGDLALEPVFMAVFERWANRLLVDDPVAFSALVDAVRPLPLTQPASQQRRRYFEGLALYTQERYPEAIAVLDRLLSEPDVEDYVRGRALNTRSICCRILGRLEEAVAGYRACLAVWRRLDNRLRQGMAHHNLAIVAYQLQNYEEAEHHLQLAMACFEEAGSAQWLAAAQNELGLVYRDQGRWDEALACLDAAAVQRRREGAQDSLGRALNNIGEVLLFQGRLEEARTTFEEALAAMHTRVYAVDVHLNLGLTRQVAGDLEQAYQAFREALDVALSIQRRDILAQVYYRLGEVLRRLGDGLAALEHFRAAAEVIESTREPLHDENLKISLLGRWQQVYESLVLHCLALGRVEDAFLWAERSRARAFADAVRKSEIGDWRSEIERQGSISNPQSPISNLQARLPAKSVVLCYFTTGVLERDVPLLRALPADSPLREHLLVPPHTLLFHLTRAGIAVHECPLDPNLFTSTAPRSGDRTRLLGTRALRRLHTSLVGAADAVSQARRLYLVPHGPLHHVPFAALMDRQNRPVVQAGGPALVYAPSATVLLHHVFESAAAAQGLQPCLAVGYDAVEGEQALRHTEAEATFVADLVGGEAWVGTTPKLSRLTEVAGQYRWLHFACHGRFDEEIPLDSYLETGPDERLTAREVLQTWHLAADLVTLSACQTGVSRILRGDEPMGLIRAFLYAGARAVLVSQWPVADLPTFLLMQRFYSLLQQMAQPDPAAALRDAQVWLCALTVAEVRAVMQDWPSDQASAAEREALEGLPATACPFAHPRYWGAFILVGE